MNKMSRRARAIAIAETKTETALFALRLFIVATCATAALIAVPALQIL